ncbi:hypothetical protein [Amycolatopsis benzoatilytica]|uniref:WD40 repeat domain-containing protein n=1 Tax=Amycolatopsis benzoatilytica TaxID=346045 RepID=UPI003CCB9968
MATRTTQRARSSRRPARAPGRCLDASARWLSGRVAALGGHQPCRKRAPVRACGTPAKARRRPCSADTPTGSKGAPGRPKAPWSRARRATARSGSGTPRRHRKRLGLRGHTGRVRVVVWSPDGRLVATGSRDETAPGVARHDRDSTVMLDLHDHAARSCLHHQPDSGHTQRTKRIGRIDRVKLVPNEHHCRAVGSQRATVSAYRRLGRRCHDLSQ